VFVAIHTQMGVPELKAVDAASGTIYTASGGMIAVLRARGSKKPALSTQPQKPTEVQTMPSDLSTLDLATINAAQGVIVAALRDQCCQWEQDSADAAADGRLSNAVMIEHWAFAADLLASVVSSEFSALFGQVLDAQFGVFSKAPDQVRDALAIDVVSQQSEPLVLCA